MNCTLGDASESKAAIFGKGNAQLSSLLTYFFVFIVLAEIMLHEQVKGRAKEDDALPIEIMLVRQQLAASRNL